MFSRLSTSVTLALAIVSFAPSVSAVSCAVCPATIFYQGLTRTLTLPQQTSGNTLQCNYDTPPISGFNPACVYRNVDGVLIITDTAGSIGALPGACPTPVPVVQKTSC